MRIVACALMLLFSNLTLAQDTHLLQRRASFAYREMQQAERDQQLAENEKREADLYAAELQKQLDAVKKESTEADARLKAARTRATQEKERWQAAAEALEKAQIKPAGR